jgi:hypothetical protein
MGCRDGSDGRRLWVLLILALCCAGPASATPIQIDPDDQLAADIVLDASLVPGGVANPGSSLLESETANPPETAGPSNDTDWQPVLACPDPSVDEKQCERDLDTPQRVGPMPGWVDERSLTHMTGDDSWPGDSSDESINILSGVLPDLTRNETIRELVHSMAGLTGDLPGSEGPGAGLEDFNVRPGYSSDEQGLPDELVALQLQGTKGSTANAIDDRSFFARAARLVLNPWSWVIGVLLLAVLEGSVELVHALLAVRSRRRRRRRRRAHRHASERMRSAPPRADAIARSAAPDPGGASFDAEGSARGQGFVQGC